MIYLYFRKLIIVYHQKKNALLDLMYVMKHWLLLKKRNIVSCFIYFLIKICTKYIKYSINNIHVYI